MIINPSGNTRADPVGPLVSIVINNYNYEKYLGRAIDSALSQTYPRTEVIVVDDGSEDGSRDIINGYGPRLTPIFKRNGGQASAINAGAAACRGDLVVFLDADDVLVADAAAMAAKVFTSNPPASKLQFKLALIDEAGRPVNRTWPELDYPFALLDLRPALWRYSNYDWPPTSGNAFPMTTLRQILPIPVRVYRICADEYLNQAAAFIGPISAVNRIFAYHRIHGGSYYGALRPMDLDQVRSEIRRRELGNRYLLRRFAGKSGRDAARAWPDILLTARKMISLKMDRDRHPVRHDSLPGLWYRGVSIALRHPASLFMKLVYVAWFTGMLVLPRVTAGKLATQYSQGSLTRRIIGQMRGGRRSPAAGESPAK
jgi:glycosyltransferase involved in cell wall biosynthesis